jgi:hypothetical protein
MQFVVELSRTEGWWTTFGGRSSLPIAMSGAQFRFTQSNALFGWFRSIHHRVDIAIPAPGRGCRL